MVEKEDEEAVKKSLEDEKERRMKEQREMDVIWEESKFMERDRKERKRKNSVVDMEDPGTGRRRKKRRTYPKLKEEWGEGRKEKVEGKVEREEERGKREERKGERGEGSGERGERRGGKR